MVIYSRCPKCGVEGLKIRQIMRVYDDVTVYKSNTEEIFKTHKELIKNNGLEGRGLFGIIVVDGKVSKLSEWK